jgi:leader peptidase (prepilin peptidase) / N-methyltransferase
VYKFQVRVITKCVIDANNSERVWGLVLHAATIFLTAVLVAISVVDLRTFRIPDAFNLPLIVSGFAVAWLMPDMPMSHHIIGAAVGFGVFATIGEVYFRRNGAEGLGLGDAKLFGAAGAWLGWQALPHVLLIAAVCGLVFAFIRRVQHRVAFGPWLAFGFWIVWIWQQYFSS